MPFTGSIDLILSLTISSQDVCVDVDVLLSCSAWCLSGLLCRLFAPSAAAALCLLRRGGRRRSRIITVSQSTVIVSEIASFTDAACIQASILVLAQLGHLVAPLRMVAILAHAGGVVVLLRVLTLRDDLTMLDLPLSKLIVLPGILAWLLPDGRSLRLNRCFHLRLCHCLFRLFLLLDTSRSCLIFRGLFLSSTPLRLSNDRYSGFLFLRCCLFDGCRCRLGLASLW